MSTKSHVTTPSVLLHLNYNSTIKRKTTLIKLETHLQNVLEIRITKELPQIIPEVPA